MVMVAGLAVRELSGVVTWDTRRTSPVLAIKLTVSPGTFKSKFQNRPPKLLVQMNVMFHYSGTT